MFFPGRLTSSDKASPSRTKPAASRSSSSRAKVGPESDLLPEYIHDENQLPCLPPERPNLRELNNSIEALAVVFPDVQVQVFRELLAHFDGESRRALVADSLLKNRVAWVKGRWKVVENQPAEPARNHEQESCGGVPRAELFRSKEYKQSVQLLAWQEFKGLSKSTINAVLAESNFSYLEARRTLVTLSTKSWRYTISSLFLGRKAPVSGEAETHPLVVWRSTGQGSIVPTIRATGNAELDRELFDTLVRPLKEKDRQEREAKDRLLALLLNNEEAERADATHECCCCFTSGPFEEFTHCNRDAHMICFRCVQHSIKEALFGQGWLRSIDPKMGTLRCVAVEGDGCSGHILYEHLRRAVLDEPKGDEILRKMDQRLVEHSLLATNLPIVRCPFCNYAEIDEIYTPSAEAQLRVKLDSLPDILFLLICIATLPLVLPVLAISSLACLLASSKAMMGDHMTTEWRRAILRFRRRRRGLRFNCQSPDCGRASCLSCNKSWTDIHVCNESSLVALRTQVEQAMSMAIKRVCPRCNTSFVKNAGCNKLTCPCGYKMCYVCRADLCEDGYRHFCDHFRPDGSLGPCRECDRCNLWESEDTDAILQEAREEAERTWKEKEKMELSAAEKTFLETGVATRRNAVSVGGVVFGGKLPSLGEVLDAVIETLFV